MAIEAFAGGEEGILNDGVSGAGTSSISSAQAYSGTYSYRTNPTTTATGSISILAPDATGALATLTAQNLRTARARVYIATLPAANEEVIFRSGAGATRKLEVRITSGGILKLYDKTPSLVATGTTALSTGVWYDIAITSQNNGGGLGSYDVAIGGVSEFSGTCDQGANNPTRIQWGKVTNTNGQSVDFYFDDLIVDNGFAYNNGVLSKFSQPTANGSTMQWTSGTGSSNYAEIDETPRSTTDYIMSTGTANDVARFPITSMSGQGISGVTIVGLYTGVYIRENVAATTATKIRMVSGATTTDGTAFDPGTTGQPYYDLFLTDPNTGSAWTETNLNAIEYGAIETNAVSTRMVWAGAYILYTPAATTTSTSLSTSTSTTTSRSTSTSSTSSSISISTSSTSSSISTSSTSSSISTSSTSSSISTSSTSSSISTSTTQSTSTSESTSSTSSSTSVSTSSTSSSTSTSESTSTSLSTSSTSTSTSISTSSTSTSVSTSTSFSTSTSTSTSSTSSSTSISTSSTSSSTSTSISTSSTSTSTSTSESTSTSFSTSTSTSSTSSSTSTSFSTSTSTSTSSTSSSTSTSISTSTSSTSTSVSTSTSSTSSSTSTSQSTSTSISTSSTSSSISTSSTSTSISTTTTILDHNMHPRVTILSSPARTSVDIRGVRAPGIQPVDVRIGQIRRRLR